MALFLQILKLWGNDIFDTVVRLLLPVSVKLKFADATRKLRPT